MCVRTLKDKQIISPSVANSTSTVAFNKTEGAVSSISVGSMFLNMPTLEGTHIYE